MTPQWWVMVWPRVWIFETAPVPVTPVTIIPQCDPYPCHTLCLPFVLTAHCIKYYFKNLVRIVNSQMKTKRNILIDCNSSQDMYTTLWHWPCSSWCHHHDQVLVVVLVNNVSIIFIYIKDTKKKHTWGIKTCLNMSQAVLGLFWYFLSLLLPTLSCWWCVLGLVYH